MTNQLEEKEIILEGLEAELDEARNNFSTEQDAHKTTKNNFFNQGVDKLVQETRNRELEQTVAAVKQQLTQNQQALTQAQDQRRVLQFQLALYRQVRFRLRRELAQSQQNLGDEQRTKQELHDTVLNFRHQLRSGSEDTLVGNEDEYPKASTSRTTQTDVPLENNPGWKNYLWQNAKKLGLAALIYSGGYYHGSQKNVSDLVECDNLLSIPQNPAQNYKVIAYNHTHSWVENLLAPSPLPDFQTQFKFPVVQGDIDNIQTGLEQEIRQLKEQNNELTKRPTPEQLIKAVEEEKNKHQHLVDPETYRANWVSPTDLETKAKEKGMVSPVDYNQRPNITLDQYQELINNQKPTDLPKNWPTELGRIPNLETEIEKLRANNTDLTDQLANTNRTLTDKEGKNRDLLLKLAEKEDEIAKQNQTITGLSQQSKNINQKLADKDQAIKKLGDDLSNANHAKQKLGTELDKVKKERDARPDIKKEDWDKDYSKRPTQKQLDEALAKVEEKFKGFIDPTKLIEEAKKELNQKNDEITALGSQLAAEKVKQKEEVDQLKKDLDQQKKERESLQDLMGNKDKENEKLKSEFEQVRREKEKLTKVFEEVAPGAAKKITVGDYLVKAAVGITGAYLSKRFIWDNKDKLWENFRQTPKVRSLETEKEHFRTQTVNLTSAVNDYVNKLADLKAEKEKLTRERDQHKVRAEELAFQLTNHTCPPCQLIHGCQHQEHVCPETCSENVHSKIRVAKEKEIVSRIIKDCQLKSDSDHNLTQVIQEIQSLIALPGGECLKVILRLEKETMDKLLSSHLSAKYNKQLEQVRNYQELAAHRSAIIKQQLAENTQQLITSNSPNIWKRPQTQTFLLGSLIITLLTAGGILIMKSRKNTSLQGQPRLVKTEKLPTLQAINQYLKENNIKSLEIDEKGGLVTRFKV